jgi:hypothetical protein
MNGEKYAAQNFLEFELVEIEIEYKIKQFNIHYGTLRYSTRRNY